MNKNLAIMALFGFVLAGAGRSLTAMQPRLPHERMQAQQEQERIERERKEQIRVENKRLLNATLGQKGVQAGQSPKKEGRHSRVHPSGPTRKGY